MSISAPQVLLERDGERDVLDTLVHDAVLGRGGIAIADGPAGIGKTALLAAAREAAAAQELTVLAATASPLDRDFPFGLVHQLFDPVLAAADEERRASLLSGAAARAGLVLDPQAGEGVAGDPSHAVLHGLYWLCANLAEREPLLLVLDDLHWADRPSLRWIEFLGRRLEGLRVAVAVAMRPSEPGADAELLAAIAEGPSARVLRPEPLSEPATATLVGHALGDEPDERFTRAARGATGGNPLLLRELARAAAEQGLRGTGEESERVTALGSRGISEAVGRRLRTLGAAAGGVARAAAVLGERAQLDDVAALAGVDVPEAVAALDRLAAAEVLESGGTRFAHPLVREAVSGAIPAGERSGLHALAAERLAARGGRPQAVATHLLSTDPAGRPEVAAALRAAARAAVAEGAVDAAMAYLRRSVAEPPSPADRGPALLELGELEALGGDHAASRRLVDAIAAGITDEQVTRARVGLGRITLLRDPMAAVATLEQAIAETTDPALAIHAESILLDATAYDPALGERRDELLAAGRADADPSPVMLAHLAQDAAYRSQPATEVEALARRALIEGGLLAAVGPESATYHLLVLALRHAELAALADQALTEGEAEARRRSSRLGGFYMEHNRVYWHLMFGSVSAAEAHCRSALAVVEEGRLPLARVTVAAQLAEILVERDQVEDAAAALRGIELTPMTERMVAGPDFLSARAQLHRLAGRLAEAEADARRAYELTRARGWTAPLKGRVGLELATVLGERGATEEAVAVIEAEEAAARRAGTRGTLGVALRVHARLLESGEARIETLSTAVDELRASPLELELAWALHDLGAVLRRERRPSDAREPLREALDTASRIGAVRLANLAREELLASGARPRREALSGPEALTPSERRVAELAARGLTNREIAESLWVTRKTVELHLSNAYGKLGIRSRAQLPGALAA
ncbi:MAG TPA: AAA family ATPase [Solirubrobacteraceae bacterium]